MYPPIGIYLASILGAAALLMMMPQQRRNLRLLGAVLAAGTLGGLWLVVSHYLSPGQLQGLAWGTFSFYYVFSAIALVAAVRVITHTRPVYSALWFVMVVLASAGLLLTLAAEFMAFAMVIIYAGAILVTYMFVIMLASQTTGLSEANADISPDYDLRARDPLAAVVMGFLLLAVLLNVSFHSSMPERVPARLSDAQMIEQVLGDRPGLASEQRIIEQLDLDPTAAEMEFVSPAMRGSERVSNVERVGIDLFQSHPLGIELAGVILLVALIGAVVIARTQVDEERPGGPAAGDASGASGQPTREPGPGSAQTGGEKLRGGEL